MFAVCTCRQPSLCSGIFHWAGAVKTRRGCGILQLAVVLHSMMIRVCSDLVSLPCGDIVMRCRHRVASVCSVCCVEWPAARLVRVSGLRFSRARPTSCRRALPSAVACSASNAHACLQQACALDAQTRTCRVSVFVPACSPPDHVRASALQVRLDFMRGSEETREARTVNEGTPLLLHPVGLRLLWCFVLRNASGRA